MELEIRDYFKKSGIDSGIYYDTKINKFYQYNRKKYFNSNQLKEYLYPFKNVLRTHNCSNYYTFREHIHDIKSNLNAVSGMFSLHELVILTDDDLKKHVELINSTSELGEVINEITKFINNQINIVQQKFTKSEYIYQILMVDIPFNSHKCIIDDNLRSIYVNDAYMVVKKILEITKKLKDGIVLTKGDGNTILIKLMSTGQIYYYFEYQLSENECKIDENENEDETIFDKK